MKKLGIFSLIFIFSSCTYKLDGSEYKDDLEIDRFEYNNHKYIKFSSTTSTYNTTTTTILTRKDVISVSIVHDPDCPCKRIKP
jgi:hypothetical protein